MQYVVVGLGGQGILFSSKVLGHIALSNNLHVMGSEVHGMAQRGGSVVSHFKIGEYTSPLVREGDADILLAFDQNEGFRNLRFLKPQGHALVNVHEPEALENAHLQSSLKERGIHLHTIPGYDILRKEMEGKFLFLNVLLLGAMGGAGIAEVASEDLAASIEALSPERFRQANLHVLELGRRYFAVS